MISSLTGATNFISNKEILMSSENQDPSELYDLEILLPVHPTGHWLDRMNAFRQFGLLGGEQLRVRLVLLCGTYELSAELHQASAWPGVESVVVINSTCDHPAAKIYDYYANILPSQELQARWYLRVDDDSLTDLRRLVNHLDHTFYWRHTLHLAGTLNTDVYPAYLMVLHDLGANRYLQGAGHCVAYHEWEASVTSHGAMKRILGNRLAREFLRRVALLPGGYGDHCLSFAARMTGIPIAQVPFLTAHCELDKFATFHASGNGFFHIHYLSPDNAEMWARYMDKRHQLGLPVDETALCSDDSSEAGDVGENHALLAIVGERELVSAGVGAGDSHVF